MRTILNTPRFRIVYKDGAGREQLADDVQAIQADVIRYDLLRRKYAFPDIKDAPMLWVTVVAWSALVRLGHDVPGEWSEAMNRMIDVTTLTKSGEQLDPDVDDPESATGVDPTRGQV